MMIQELTIDQLSSMTKWMEQDDGKIYFKLLADRENFLLEQLTRNIPENETEQTRGRIRELRYAVLIHDVALDEMQKKIDAQDVDSEPKKE